MQTKKFARKISLAVLRRKVSSKDYFRTRLCGEYRRYQDALDGWNEGSLSWGDVKRLRGRIMWYQGKSVPVS